MSCTKKEDKDKITLITLDPGHFHAALVQKTTYDQIDSTAYVYAPEGPELNQYLTFVDLYNNQDHDPTNWNEVVYRGEDYLAKMLADHQEGIVVLSGNNEKKSEYILQSISNGLNVLSDKPMAIDHDGFLKLEKAFALAEEKGLKLYDIMTERFEITNSLQRALASDKDLFGVIKAGTVEEPAIVEESGHYFFKQVSGKPLVRPAWFFDIDQQGEGIVDVTTHLVDLAHWKGFPDQTIDHQTHLELIDASRWPTSMDTSQFFQVTGLTEVPPYLRKNLDQKGDLLVYANGDVVYKVKNTVAKISVKWDYASHDGGGDTYFSIMRGTRANLVIKQEKEQHGERSLYIESSGNRIVAEFDQEVQRAIEKLSTAFPGLSLSSQGQGVYKVNIPQELHKDHETHFAMVTNKYIGYMEQGMPKWEVPNMLSKYFVLTEALKLARSKGDH